MKIAKYLGLTLAVIIMASCASKAPIVYRKSAYPEFYRNKLSTILIMPPINKTNKVEAKEFFFTTLNRPLCESGYYVIPPYLSMEIFKNESAYDSELFVDRPVDKFAGFFNADLVLFTIIHKWEKKAIGGTITVDVEYIMKSAKTNTIVFTRRGVIGVDTSVNTGLSGGLGFLANLALTAANTAATPHIAAAKACNVMALVDLPLGQYNPSNAKDSTVVSGAKNFTLKNLKASAFNY